MLLKAEINRDVGTRGGGGGGAGGGGGGFLEGRPGGARRGIKFK